MQGHTVPYSAFHRAEKAIKVDRYKIQSDQLYSDGFLEIVRYKKKHAAQQVKKQLLKTVFWMQTEVPFSSCTLHKHCMRENIINILLYSI